MLLKSSSVFLTLYVFTAFSHAANPEVETPLGKIKGSNLSTVLNKTIYAFRGIRYAKSTEGERRFKIAESVDPWTDVFDATQDGPSCSLYDSAEIANEDCLRLNVYTTKLPSASENVKRPVIVFLHPNAFQSYSARSNYYGPQYLLDEDVVLVTINFRLATFGFISTGDARAPGNLGFKDQVYALRWIQKNIEAFGGDVNSVTLTACSAGSVGAILHMLSPMSQGLFHRVFISSGAPETRIAMSRNETDILLAQANLVDCPIDNVDNALACLKITPRQKYASTMYQFFLSHGVNIWEPVIEPEIPGVERFLTDEPVNLIKQGKFTHVPLVLGITKDELLGSIKANYEAALNGNSSGLQTLDANWYNQTPRALKYDRETERSQYISHELKKFYFNDKPITVDNALELGKMWSDGNIGFQTYRAVKLMAQYSRVPVYYYMFTYQGRYSNAVWTATQKPMGVVHMDELLYLLTSTFKFPIFNATDPEFTTVKKMTGLWSNFAKTGQVNPSGNNLFSDLVWDKFDLQKENYLEIGEAFTTKYKMYAERYAFWDNLFSLK